jgi:hypothetical protein
LRPEGEAQSSLDTPSPLRYQAYSTGIDAKMRKAPVSNKELYSSSVAPGATGLRRRSRVTPGRLAAVQEETILPKTREVRLLLTALQSRESNAGKG